MSKSSRATLRRYFRQRRRNLSDADRQHANQRIFIHLLSMPGLWLCENVGAYLASNDEAGLDSWIRHAWRRQFSVWVPYVHEEDNLMHFAAHYKGAALQPGRYGLLHPSKEARRLPASDLDALLVPLVAFDAQGTRLGMGGGYYDRHLANFKTRPKLIGIAYSTQFSAEPLPLESWDVPLDAAVTETGIRYFSHHLTTHSLEHT
mgnify:CR=1 FL=1